MNLIRHYVGALIMFAMLFSLFGGTYSAFKVHYEFTDTYTGINGTTNIAERIESMGIIQSLETFTDGVFSVLNPSDVGDIIGGLMATAFGALGLLFGLFLLPVEILGVITGFYYIPPIVSVSLGTLVLVYLGFIYLSARARNEL